MTSGPQETEDIGTLISELDDLASKDRSRKAIRAVRDSLVGIREARLRGEDREMIERRVGGLFKIVSDSSLFGTPMMDRILRVANDQVKK